MEISRDTKNDTTHFYRVRPHKISLLLGSLTFIEVMILQDCHGIRKTENLEVQFSRQAKHGEFAKKY